MDLPVSDAPVGRLLDGRYRVESLLARGGMATVYRATDTRLDRTVALKVMHAELAADDAFVSRFIGEARSVARLSDPHIVGVFDQGEDEGAVFLAMEYIKGRTLRDLLREQGRIEADLTLEILEAVLAALRAAHEAEIVHRDVKPENVLISDDGRVKVADFGLARPSSGPSNATTRGLLLGTVNYISPEQALGDRATPRSDVYAAGIMLYELLTGRPPHTGPTDFVVVRAHIDEPVPPPSEAAPVPRAVDELVFTATNRDPAGRFADAGAFLAAVRLARASMASGDTGTLASHTAPGIILPPPPQRDQDDQGPIEIAEAFHRDSGRVPDADSPEEASGPIEVANSFYHEASTTPPVPAPPAEAGAPPPSSRTRVIDVARQNRDVAAATPPAPAEEANGSGGGESGRAGRRAGARASRRRWRGPVLFLLVILLAAAVTITAWWFGSGRWTSTPALLNLDQVAAEAAADDAGLSVTTEDEDFSEVVDEGLVLRTDPGPGEQILRGGTVSLTLSQGPERYEVPDLGGMTRDQATSALEDRNLVATFKESHDPDVDEGEAIAQDIEAGEQVRPETEVSVSISLGPEPIEIPGVTGESADEATGRLEDAGFTVDSSETFSDDVEAGRVISQDPADGTGFAGDEVSIVVSQGPEIVDVEVPDLIGEPIRDAEGRLEDLGFDVVVERQFPGGGRWDRHRTVLAQEPSGGMVPPGTTVTIFTF